jgi:hypothetical protein
MKSRLGAGLAEMIVALTLSAIVSAAGATALASAERYARASRATADARRTLREAAAVLTSDLRVAPSDSVRVRGDTALDFLGLVGVSAVCVSSGAVLVLPPDVSSSGMPYSSWRTVPETGDILALFDTAGAGGWKTAIVDSAAAQTNAAGCRPSSGLMSSADSVAHRPVTRVVLQTSFSPAVAIVGAPVRVLRSGRYALTRAADRSWSLSYRRCAGSSCAVAQPVAGPFAAPADSGVVFGGDPSKASVDVFLRTPPAAGRPGESAQLHLAFRNHATGAP